MIKIYTRFLLTAVMLMVSIVASAYDFEVDGIFYNILSAEDKMCEVTEYGDAQYSGDVSIPKSVEYSDETYSVTSIGEYAFYRCSRLTSVTIPSSMTSIGHEAFGGCSGLTSVTIPNSVTSIGDLAFHKCSGLTSVTIPSSVTSIGEYAFYRCSRLTSVTIPSSVTSIGTSVFSSCSGLTSVTIPSSVSSIGSGAFEGCKGLTSVTIPSSVIGIGPGAFLGCSGLTSVTIPSSVTSIGSGAFSGCSGLTSVTIPSSVTSIGGSTFSGCSCLTSIKVEEGNTVYDSRDNCNAIIETASNTLISGCKNTIIPSGVTSIGNYAFWICPHLTSITIPSSVTSIGERAFEACTGLTSITIPSSVTSIGEWAFDGCSGLTSITNLAKEPQTLGDDVFRDVTASNVTLHVLSGCKAAYEAADQWKDFNIVEDAMDPTGIEEIENGELEIENYAIYDLSGRRLNTTPQKGVFIKNGKKYLK